MKKRTETLTLAEKVPTDAEVRDVVFRWAKNWLRNVREPFAEYITIEIIASTEIGSCDVLMTVATKDWRPYSGDEPLPGIYGQAEESA